MCLCSNSLTSLLTARNWFQQLTSVMILCVTASSWWEYEAAISCYNHHGVLFSSSLSSYAKNTRHYATASCTGDPLLRCIKMSRFNLMTWCPVWMMPYLTTIDTTIDYSTRQAIFLMDQVTWWMMDELSFISPDMQYSSDDTQYLSSSPYFSCSTRQHHQSPVKSAATRRLDVTRTIYQQTSSEPLVPAKLTLYHDGFTMSGSVWSLLWMKSTGLLSQVLQHGRYCIQKWEWQWYGSTRTRNLDQQHPKTHESWRCSRIATAQEHRKWFKQ